MKGRKKGKKVKPIKKAKTKSAEKQSSKLREIEKHNKYKVRVREDGGKGKPLKIEKIPSGIPGLDKITGGGLQKESVILVVGGAGSGKTIFATQFLVEGAKRGEPGVFITFEEKKKRFYREMLELGFNLADLEKKKKFAFIEYTPEQVKKMLEEGGGEIEVAIEEMKAKRIVIDSISSFALLFESELVKREAALSLFELLRKWNVTSVLTLEHEPLVGMTAEHLSSPIEFEVDGIILLYFLRPDGSRIRSIEILKMRGAKHSKQMLGFEIGNGGLKISKKVIHFKVG